MKHSCKNILFAFGLAAMGGNALSQADSGQAPPDVRPALDFSSCSRPVYPEEDARAKHAGTVTVYFLLSPEGKVLDSKVQKSSGHRALDEAARSALAKCSFTPPRAGGKPVQAWTAVQYVWSPD